MKYLKKSKLLVGMLAVGAFSPFNIMAADSSLSSKVNSRSNIEANSDLYGYGRWPGFIVGQVWNDRDSDGRPDYRERGLKRVTVYIDANDNGMRDADEISTRTNRAGFYAFWNLAAGDYIVRQDVAFGWRNISGGEGTDAEPTLIENDRVVTQIIGGDVTQVNEYPFMVAVGALRTQGFRQLCGGVLISDRWVATASHCSVDTDPAEVGVLAGTNNTTDGSGQVLAVKKIHLHPDYVVDPPEPGAPFSVGAGYDIALWELEEPVMLKESGLESVAMLSPRNDYLADVGVLATAVGWGRSDLQSRLLQDVHVPISDENACADVYSTSINFETQICASAPEGGVDACQDDSGGPLLVRDFYADKWKLAGVTSYGNGCALPGNPGVWARTSVLSAWAKSVAVEPSRVHRVTVRAGDVSFASFGNSRTRYEPSSEIEPRWQLVNTAFNNDPEEGMTFDSRIIDESGWPRVFDCIADSDGRASLPGSSSECFEGTNQSVLPALEGDGVFIQSLTAKLDDTTFTRTNNLVVGTPVEQNDSGELTSDDPTDPDFPNTPYFIDYFDIAGLSAEKAVKITVESSSFDSFVGLYDRGFREANGGGGTISTFSGIPGSPAELFFFPESDTNYVIGVSTFDPEAVGEYKVTILNDGDVEPTVLTMSTNFTGQAFLKMPGNRVVIPDTRKN